MLFHVVSRLVYRSKSVKADFTWLILVAEIEQALRSLTDRRKRRHRLQLSKELPVLSPLRCRGGSLHRYSATSASTVFILRSISARSSWRVLVPHSRSTTSSLSVSLCSTCCGCHEQPSRSRNEGSSCVLSSCTLIESKDCC